MKTIIGSDYPKIVIPLIDNAKKNIDIAVYDWRWYPNQPGHAVQRFNNAVARAVGRGVVVRAIVHNRSLLPTLTKIGVLARGLSDHRTLHVKLLMIDNQLLVVGSHNFSRNAFGSNIEASVLLEIPPEETRLLEFFNNLYGL